MKKQPNPIAQAVKLMVQAEKYPLDVRLAVRLKTMGHDQESIHRLLFSHGRTNSWHKKDPAVSLELQRTINCLSDPFKTRIYNLFRDMECKMCPMKITPELDKLAGAL